MAIPTEPEWRAIHRAADANVPIIERIVLRALRAAQAGTNLNAIADSVEAGGGVVLGKVFEGADEADRIMAEELPAALLSTLNAGALASARFYRSQGGFLPDDDIDQSSVIGDGPVDDLAPVAAAEGGVSSVFIPPSGDLPGFALSPDFMTTNQESVDWSKRYGSKKIVQISNETRRTIRQMISQAFVDGIPPAKAAQAIRKEIGLTRFQANAVRNLAQEMQDRQRGLVRRGGKQFGPRVPKGGYSSVQIQAATKRYGERLLRERALTIARTETIAAANEGQRRLWLEGRKNGSIPSFLVKEWIVTPDDALCPVCRGMIGQQRELDKQFNTGRFGPVQRPPAHPKCRCAMGLAKRKKAKTTKPQPLSVGDRLAKSPISKSTKLSGKSLNTVTRMTVRESATGEEAVGYWKPGTMDTNFEPRLVKLVDDTIGQSGGTFADREVMASQMDDILGTRLVPKTVYRTVDDVAGSIQLEGEGIVGDVMTIDDILPALRDTVERQQDLTLFDIVLGNTDRHAGNVLIAEDITAIDNGFALMAGDAGKASNVWTVNETFASQELLLTPQRTRQWLARLKDPRINELLGDGRINKAAVTAAKKRIADLVEVLEGNGNFWRLLIPGG